MRIGLVPEGVRERLVLRSPRFPQPLFDVMGTMLLSRAVMAGVHFGVFDCLARGPKTPAALAAETGCDPHGMELLLDALAACGYLEKDDGGFRNARVARRWLLSDAQPTLANFVRYNYHQWDWVSHLEDYIQRGEARDIHANPDAPHWRNYLLGLRDLATLSADEVVGKIKFKAAPRSLLDLGGGHAYYSIAMCRHHPTLQATVLDLEPAARLGRELVAQAGLRDRIHFRVGNLSETPFGDNHDVAFLFNVVHHLDEAANRRCLEHVHAALNAGGRLVIWEAFREERARQRENQVGSLLALFFGLVSRQQTCEFEQVAGWARAAGFRQIEREKLRTAPFVSLLVATK